MKRLFLILALLAGNFIYGQPKITYIDDEEIVAEHTALYGAHLDLANLYTGSIKIGVDFTLNRHSLITAGFNITGGFPLPYEDFIDFYGNTLYSSYSKPAFGLYGNYKWFIYEGIMDEGSYLSIGASLSRYLQENDNQANYSKSTLLYTNIFLGFGYQFSFGNFYLDQGLEIGFRKENFNGENVFNNNPQFNNRNRNLMHLSLGFKIGYILANENRSNIF